MAGSFFSSGRSFFMPVVVFLLTIGIQVWLFYLQTGKPYVWTYQGEGFDFGKPEIISVLFSYRKGLFVYTPVLLFAVAGLLTMMKGRFFRFITGTCYFILLTLVIASWWNWYYGDSFGLRAYIDHYPFFAILLASFIHRVKYHWLRPVLYSIFGILCFLNLFQTYQYEHNILDRDAMDKEKYWYVFMKTGKEYENLLSGLGDARFFRTDTLLIARYTNNFDTTKANWVINALKKPGDTAYSGNQVCLFDTATQYNAGLKIVNDSSFVHKGAIIVTSSLMIYDLSADASLKLLLVAQITSLTGEREFYKTYRLKAMPSDTYGIWKNVEVEYRIPEIKNMRDELDIYLWNQEKQCFYIDDLKHSFYRLKADTIRTLDQLRR